jgi:threonine/homoserine/homoserine lactone efflux protein
MAAGSIAAFWAVAMLLIVIPGADWAYVIATVLAGRSVLPAVGGLVLGYTAMTAVVAVGVGTLVARTPAALTVLTVTGGLYLIWLGAKTFTRPSVCPMTADADAGTRRGTLVTGIGVSGLNPKGLVLFLALLPQFTSPRGSLPLAAQLAILGLVFTLSCAAFYLCMGSAARTVLNARPAVARAISRCSGVAMVLVGLLLLTERLLG